MSGRRNTEDRRASGPAGLPVALLSIPAPGRQIGPAARAAQQAPGVLSLSDAGARTGTGRDLARAVSTESWPGAGLTARGQCRPLLRWVRRYESCWLPQRVCRDESAVPGSASMRRRRFATSATRLICVLGRFSTKPTYCCAWVIETLRIAPNKSRS